MKRYILILLAAFLAFSSCKKLDRFPTDQIASENFWKSKADFDQALAAVYASMQNAMWSYGAPNWDCLTDNAYGQHDNESSVEIVSGEISPSTGGYITDVYNLSYQGIARINIFLQQLADYQGTDITEADKKTYEAEVRFLRGYYYFQLYYSYGDVPLVLKPLTIEDQYQPKVAADTILTQILTDLDFAATNLSPDPYYKSNGHAVASSAQALEARVLLFSAFDNTGTPNIETLKQVRDLCLKVEAKYSLSPVFEDLFRDKGQPGNTGIIFSVNFLAPDDVAQWDLWNGDWINVSPLQNFVDAFECTDGLPISRSPRYDPQNPEKNRDPRLGMTVFVDHPDFGAGKVHYPTNSRPTGYGVKKFLEPDNIPYGYTTLSQQNAVTLRLGEVLLMYAEAENEIAGPDPSVYSAMTRLRARVHMPPYPSGLSKDQMRTRIRHERRVELAFEGLRYYDLKRWHTATQVLNSVTDGVLHYTFKDKFYKWPLPQIEIDKSHGVLVQNPDYQ